MPASKNDEKDCSLFSAGKQKNRRVDHKVMIILREYSIAGSRAVGKDRRIQTWV
jgi:hypothetical protein